MRRPFCIVCLLFALLIIGIVEFFPYEYDFPKELSGEVVLVKGKVKGKEIKSQNGQITYFIYLEPIMSQSASNTENFSDSNFKLQKLNKAEGILCYMTDTTYIPNIGSLVQLKGEVAVFEEPDNPGEFNAPLYYKIKGIDLKMYDCSLESYGENYAVVKENLFRLKTWFSKIIDTCFREEYRGIAKAIVLGMSGSLSEETKELYQRSGMLHILCVSGLHISILGMGLFKLLKQLGTKEAMNAAICILMMFLYGLMIGMGTSVVRAILMFSLRLLARLLGRTYDLLTASCVGIFLILMEQPLYIYHSGFLLSFLSVIALGAFRTLFPSKLSKIEYFNQLVDSFFSTLTVWIVTLPVYGRGYYEVSVTGLVINVIILPFVSVVLVLVIGVCVLGSFYLPIGIGVARLCEMFLWGFEAVFECFDKLSYTNLILGHIPLYKCLVYYLGLVIISFLAEKVRKRYVCLVIFLLSTFLFIHVPKPLTITCLAVGQGDSAVIEYGMYTCIIDAGSSSEGEVSKYTLLPFLKYRGIRKVDYLFLTHGDSDHINAVAELLTQNRYGVKIKRLVVTDGRYREDYGKIFDLAFEMGIPIYEMKQDDVVNLGEVQLKCLSPSPELLNDYTESSNETSMVLLLEKDNFSMLFTGDSEGKGEQEVIDRLRRMNIYDLTALKVAHHGSKNSTKEEFLEIVHPGIGIVSCGENNLYGHPHHETLRRLDNVDCKVFITKDSGAVTIRVGRKIEVRGYRPSD